MRTSEPKVNMVCLSDRAISLDWDLGERFTCPPAPQALWSFIEAHLVKYPADAWLFWDPGLGFPEKDYILSKLSEPADVWHTGLKLGLAGQPEMINHVQPTWMLNRDPDPDIAATSWRLSLRACLVRTEVLRQLGGPDPNFATLAGAGLELGFRYIKKGAFLRYDPNLIDKNYFEENAVIPLQDQLRFLHAGFDRRWKIWSGFRAVLNRKVSLSELRQASERIKKEDLLPEKSPYQREHFEGNLDKCQYNVSVLIPTLRRYPYLRTLLNQLRSQTIPPYEVLIVDQTPPELRDPDLLEDYEDLPLRYFTMEHAGQCASRNLGLKEAKGDFIMFIDDDDEIEPDLIGKHLDCLQEPGLNISNGVAHEIGAGELPVYFKHCRISDVFPTNNTMIRKKILEKSGLFDLAYDLGQRADHDLGMRLYLSGELMVLNPHIQVLHHHAPMGGLRQHKARVDTYAASRQRLFRRNLSTISDIYLAKRYFSEEQVREMLWISLLGTFSIRGGVLKRMLKILIGTFLLPYNLWTLLKRCRAAEALLANYPQIPDLL